MNIFKKDKIAIFSDIHIGVKNDSKFYHDVSLKWAEWFISDISSKGISDIVFCGDYFHARDELAVDTLSFGTKLLKLFKDFNVHLLVGNHDAYFKDSSEVNSISQYNEWENVSVYSEPFHFQHNGKNINFIPWGTTLEQIKPAHYTFGHFEIVLFKMNTFSLCEDGFTAEELLQKSNMVISGHFHLRDQRNYSDGTILYVGNPFQMDFNDAGTTKGYYTLDINTGELEFTENTISPKHINLSLSFLLSEKTITNKVKELVSGNIVKFKVDRRTNSDDLEFISSKLNDLGPLEFMIEYSSDICEYNMDEEKRDLSGIDLEKAIVEFVDEMDINQKSDIIKYVLNLLHKHKN